VSVVEAIKHSSDDWFSDLIFAGWFACTGAVEFTSVSCKDAVQVNVARVDVFGSKRISDLREQCDCGRIAIPSDCLRDKHAGSQTDADVFGQIQQFEPPPPPPPSG
jgi:hypothetical protein